MWDKFRRWAPKVAAGLSAVRSWVKALSDGSSLSDANRAAENRYNTEVLLNRSRSVVQGIVAAGVNLVENLLGADTQDRPRMSESDIRREAASEAEQDSQMLEGQLERAKAKALKRCTMALKNKSEISARDIKIVLGTLSKEKYAKGSTLTVGFPTQESIKLFLDKMNGAKDPQGKPINTTTIKSVKVKDNNIVQTFELAKTPQAVIPRGR